MTAENTAESEESIGESDISRRRVMRVLGGTGVGLAAGVGTLAGTASAHAVTTIAFCGCTQVTVYGVQLGDSDYEAILYCDGELETRTLTGTQTRQNYDMDADSTIGEDDDCQIIAVEGQTYSSSEGTQNFTICNEHCPWNCATRGIEEFEDDDTIDFSCDDPDSFSSGGGAHLENEIEGINIQCGGCGREEPGLPGNGPPVDPRNNGGPSGNSRGR